MTSATVIGVGRDAKRIARAIEARTRVSRARLKGKDEGNPAMQVRDEAGLGQLQEVKLAKKTL